MRLNYFFKFILLLQVFYSFNTRSAPCPLYGVGATPVVVVEGEAIKITNIEAIHLNEVEANNFIYADSIDVEFWVGQCITENKIEYSLVATITPTIPGKTRGAGLYDIAIIQNNKQFDGALYFTDNLFVPSVFSTVLTTWFHPSESVPFYPLSGLDLSKTFTLIHSCSSSASNTECSTINPDKFQEINPQPVSNSPTISSVNGTWYDPEYNGSGFTMMQTPTGFVMFYYGYKAAANGKTLWLLSSTGPKTINKGETFTLDMLSGFPGNGGSLTTKPTTENSGTSKWGTAEVTFNTCNSGVIKLVNNNGVTVTHNIILLAGVDELTCRD